MTKFQMKVCFICLYVAILALWGLCLVQAATSRIERDRLRDAHAAEINRLSADVRSLQYEIGRLQKQSQQNRLQIN